MIRKSGKGEITERIELPNQERIRTLGKKETHKSSGILEADITKLTQMKEKMSKEYPI